MNTVLKARQTKLMLRIWLKNVMPPVNYYQKT